MELSVDMIMDFIREGGIETGAAVCAGGTFSDFRLYYPGAARDGKHLYYCGPGTDLPPEQEGLYTIRAVVMQELDSGSPREIRCGCGEEQLLELLLECFSYYKDWYMKMNECLLKGEGLQKLVQMGSSMFKNPVIVDDSSFRILAFTQEYQEELTDPESVFLARNGYHSPDYIRRITDHPVFLKNMNLNMEPFIHHYEFLEHESIYCPIRCKSRIAGFLTIVGLSRPFTRGQLHLAKIFAEVASSAFSLSGHFQVQNRPDDNILLDFLNRRVTEEELIRVCLDKAGLEGEERYYIAYLTPVIESGSNYFVLTRLFDQMKERIRKGKVLMEENGIIMIVNEMQMSRVRCRELLEERVLSHKLAAGFSMSFQDLAGLPYYYTQAERSVFWGQKLCPGENLFSYEKYMFYDILSRSMERKERAAIVHPAIFDLEKSDRERKSELEKTLLSYISHNGNRIQAAKELHIHKNSLYYRLNQIEDITGLDLEDGAVCEYLHVSFLLKNIIM